MQVLTQATSQVYFYTHKCMVQRGLPLLDTYIVFYEIFFHVQLKNLAFI